MPLLYAHRGAAAERPENTLPSFRRALELGADALEMDVHRTSDGHVVVSHDPRGARMAGVPRAIRDCTLAQVRRWDAGLGFIGPDQSRPWAGRGIEIPTLDEVLREFADVPLNIDIKQARPSMVDDVVDLIRAHDAEARVTLGSFHESNAAALRRRNYAGGIALTRVEVVALFFAGRPSARLGVVRGTAAQIPTGAGPFDFATESFIGRCHDLGIRVDFWTINDPAEARRLLDLGADGIMTDDPALIAPVFGKTPAT